MDDNVKFTLKTMTDADIIKQAEGKEVLNASDYNLKGRDADGRADSGGLFDPAIFGKVGKCVCGFTKAKDNNSAPVRCPHCRTLVFSNGEDWRRNSAYFRLTIPVIFPYKVEKFWDILRRSNISIYKPSNVSSGTWQSKLLLLWNSAYHVEPTKEEGKKLLVDNKGNTYELQVTEVGNDTPFSEIGLVGLYNLQSFSLYKGGTIDFSDYLNTVIPITSTYFRNSPISRRNGQRVLELDKRTVQYRSIITYVMQMQTSIASFLISSIDIATVYYNLNVMVAILVNSSELLEGGKWHTVRDNLRTRVRRSGRANIVPALDVDMDHVKIPRSLAYEALNGDIIEELSKIMDYSEAKEEVKTHSVRAEAIFRQLVDESMVILLRNPTLHKEFVA